MKNSDNSQSNPLPASATEPSREDKRYLPRWETKNRIHCQVENDQHIYECFSIDLNSSGTCLLTEQDIPKNEKVKLTIFLSDKKAVEVQGQMIWKKSSDKGHLIGFSFQNTLPEIQDQILESAFEISEADIINQCIKNLNNNLNKFPK